MQILNFVVDTQFYFKPFIQFCIDFFTFHVGGGGRRVGWRGHEKKSEKKKTSSLDRFKISSLVRNVELIIKVTTRLGVKRVKPLSLVRINLFSEQRGPIGHQFNSVFSWTGLDRELDQGLTMYSYLGHLKNVKPTGGKIELQIVPRASKYQKKEQFVV